MPDKFGSKDGTLLELMTTVLKGYDLGNCRIVVTGRKKDVLKAECGDRKVVLGFIARDGEAHVWMTYDLREEDRFWEFYKKMK